MPKKPSKILSPGKVGTMPPGMHAAGEVTGLYLRVTPSGTARNWILRAVIGGRRRDMGLGGWPDVSLAEARERARAARRKITEEGIDPIAERTAKRAKLRSIPTFKWCAEQTIAAKRPGWKNAKHAEQWENTLATYAFPVIGQMPVDLIGVPDVLAVVTPIWESKTETAKRVRMRIEAVLAWATVAGYREGDNPAQWRGRLEHSLAPPSKIAKVEHHAALPYAEIHDFMLALRAREGIATRALEFAILTAARSGEVRGATWDEIDLEGAVWTIPGDRMKADKEHRVSLSPRAVALLEALPRVAGSRYVFTAPRGGMLSDMALSAVLRRMKVDAVPHGFRSTFRDWAAEVSSYPGEMAEMALAHTIDSKTEKAYRRGDMLAKRARMMSDWSDYIDSAPATDNVTPFRLTPRSA